MQDEKEARATASDCVPTNTDVLEAWLKENEDKTLMCSRHGSRRMRTRRRKQGLLTLTMSLSPLMHCQSRCSSAQLQIWLLRTLFNRLIRLCKRVPSLSINIRRALGLYHESSSFTEPLQQKLGCTDAGAGRMNGC
ncbi:hypothetical protein AMTR_s00115p00086520 [Amborella trichopoda]|uniref:Uncharacterized protein n=1 Tax=Amborella trichopoda TaxID=13333 RepID=W1NQV0_AMBTC|nr:hypothetical protein AMTR_s00115p00086520 [Amborella trichopoda]